jgi:hypothetical protein
VERFAVWAGSRCISRIKICTSLSETSLALREIRAKGPTQTFVTVGLTGDNTPYSKRPTSYRVYARDCKSFALQGTVVAIEDAQSMAARLKKAENEVVIVQCYTDK